MKMKFEICYQGQFFAAGCGVFAGIGLIALTWSEASEIFKGSSSMRLFILGFVLVNLAVAQYANGRALYRKSKSSKNE